MGSLEGGIEEVERDGTVDGVETKIKCLRYKSFEGRIVDVPKPDENAPESVKGQWSPFTFVDPTDSNLPESAYPITLLGKMAVGACPDGNYSWFAQDLGVPVELVQKWVKDGLDWRQQTYGRDRVPVLPGEMWKVPGNEVRLMAMHRQPVGRSVTWMPDWTQGDLLGGFRTTSWFPPDHPLRIWQTNNFRDNAPFFKRGILDLRGSWKGKPVILAGTGPSMDWQAENIQAVAGNENVKVLSCNLGLKLLGPEAIDYYLMMDWMAREAWFDGVDCGKTELIAQTTSSSLSRGHWPEDRIRFFASNLRKDWLPEEEPARDKLGFLLESQAVSVAMLFFAFHVLQANPIILCGFDLCFPGMLEYPGVRLPFDRKPDGGWRFTQEYPSGNLALTADHLLNQRAAIDVAAVWCRKAGRRIINTSPVSILRNKDRMGLDEAIKRFVVGREDPSADEQFKAIRNYETVMLSKEGVIH